MEVPLVHGAEVGLGRQLCLAAQELWRGPLELRVLCGWALGLGFLSGDGKVEILDGPMQEGEAYPVRGGFIPLTALRQSLQVPWRGPR